MEKQFVPYDLALRLKKLGFDEKCFGVYYSKDGDVRIYDGNESGDAPLWQQAFDWFRDEHNMSGEVFLYGTPDGFAYGIYNTIKTEINDVSDIIGNFKEARLECLRKLIEFVENKKG